MNNFCRIAWTVPLAFALAYCTTVLGAPSDEDVSWIADKSGCKVANTFPRPGETITWTGGCKGGFAQGAGVLQWFLNGKEDDRYEGPLEMGWAEGKGVLYRADGGKYDGEWQHSVQQGSGRYEAPDGSWYEGEWKNGKPNGHGQYRRPDGKIFIGEWVDGVYEGDMEGPQEEEQQADPNRT